MESRRLLAAASLIGQEVSGVSNPQSLTAVGGAVYYIQEDPATGAADQLWAIKAPGTATVLVKDFAGDAPYPARRGSRLPWSASAASCISCPGAYAGDDLTVFRPSTATFYVLNTSTGAISIRQWGIGGDLPLAAPNQ